MEFDGGSKATKTAEYGCQLNVQAEDPLGKDNAYSAESLRYHHPQQLAESQG